MWKPLNQTGRLLSKFLQLNMKSLVSSTGGTCNNTSVIKKMHIYSALCWRSYLSHIMFLQVPGVLLPHGPGVLLCCPAASQAGAVRNEGSHQDVEGARRGRPGTRQIQRRSAGYDSHWVGQRSVAGGAYGRNAVR